MGSTKLSKSEPGPASVLSRGVLQATEHRAALANSRCCRCEFIAATKSTFATSVPKRDRDAKNFPSCHNMMTPFVLHPPHWDAQNEIFVSKRENALRHMTTLQWSVILHMRQKRRVSKRDFHENQHWWRHAETKAKNEGPLAQRTNEPPIHACTRAHTRTRPGAGTPATRSRAHPPRRTREAPAHRRPRLPISARLRANHLGHATEGQTRKLPAARTRNKRKAPNEDRPRQRAGPDPENESSYKDRSQTCGRIWGWGREMLANWHAVCL
jgi:hypothetical protein